jgi:phosphate transport system substrate-binding protein
MKKSRRSLGVAATLLLCIALLSSGCGLLQNKQEDNSLLIAGSKQFAYYSNLFQQEFTKENKNTTVVIQDGDTTPGILALRNGAIDIAIASRDLNENEDDKFTKSYLVTKDAIHIIVNQANPIADLTIAQLKSIYTGKVDNWKQLGGSDLPIQLISSDIASDSYAGLNDLVMEGEDVVSGTTTKASGKEIIEAVAGDKQAIGFVASRDLNQTVKMLTVNKIEANRNTIYSGTYPLTRSFYFIVKSEPSKLTQNFVDFFLNKKGQALLQEEGALPLH